MREHIVEHMFILSYRYFSSAHLTLLEHVTRNNSLSRATRKC